MTSGDTDLMQAEPGRLNVSLLVAGAIALAAALTVMAGWAYHVESVIRLSPGFSPMRFNTAAGLCLLGLSQLAIALRQRTAGLTLAALAGLLGIVTLVEHLFQLSLGIDQLLMVDWIGFASKTPGRMATSTALSLPLMASEMILLYRSSPRTFAGAMCGVIVIAMATAVLLFYLLGIDAAHQPQTFGGMGLNSALLFILLGTASLAGQRQLVRDDGAQWLPTGVAVGVTALTLVLWYGTDLQNQASSQRDLEAKAASARTVIDQSLKERANALRRMADRWQTRGGTPRAEWEADAGAYLHDWPDAIHLDRVDRDGRLLWAMPVNDSQAGARAGQSSCHSPASGETAFEAAARASDASPTVSISLRSAALSPDGNDGFLCAEMQLKPYVEALMRALLDTGHYQLRIDDGLNAPVVIGGEPDPRIPGAIEFIRRDGLNLQLALRPTPAMTAVSRNLIPAAILSGGLFFALLLASTVRLLLTSKRQAAELRSSQASLGLSERRHRDLLDSLQYGVFVIQDDRFSLLNPAMPAMFGYDRDAFRELRFAAVVDASSLADWNTHYAAAGNNGRGDKTTVELHCHARDGGDLWILLSLQPYAFESRAGVLGIAYDISDQKRAVARARYYQERLELVARGSVDGLWDWNLITNETYYSERFHELLGYEFGELAPVLDTFEKLLHPDDHERTFAAIRESMEQHTPYSVEYRLRTKPGDYRWFRVRGQGLWGASGEPVRLAGSIEDIMEHRQRAEALESAHALQSAILGSAKFSVIATTADGLIISFNATAERMLGYAADEVVGKLSLDFTHDREEVVARAVSLSRELGRSIAPGFEVFVASCREGAPEDREWTYVRKDGSRFPVLLSVTAIRDNRGNITGFLATGIDITERKKNEEQIKRLLSILEECPDFIGMADMQGRLQYHNRAARRMVGIADDHDMAAMMIADMHPEWAGALVVNAGIPAVLRRGTWQSDNALLHADGHEVPVSQVLMLHRDADGNPQFLSTIMRDISERLRADDARSRLAAIVESSDDAIVSITLDGTISSWNAGAERMFGYTAHEALDQPVSMLRPADLAPETAAFIAGLTRDQHSHVDDAIGLRKDGGRLYLSLSITPQRDATGRVVSGSWIARDVAERHEQTARIEASLKEKEALLREVYHRVKNNLQVIQSLIALQARTLDNPPARQALEDTSRRVRAMALVHEKLYQSGNLAAVSLPEFVRDLFKQLRDASIAQAPGVQMLAEIDPIKVGLEIAVPLSLLITELVSNSIRHGFPDDRSGDVLVRLQRDGQGAVLTIMDTGVGLPPDFTLEKTTSMGLTLAKTLARQLRSQLETPSLPGAQFRVRIPAI